LINYSQSIIPIIAQNLQKDGIEISEHDIEQFIQTESATFFQSKLAKSGGGWFKKPS